MTDPYPDENTWEILTESGDLVQAGTLENEGRTSTVIIPICIDPDSCYTFTIFDSFGDGMATSGDPEGSYAIYNEDRELIVSILRPDFGEQESNEFCLDGGCHLEASVSQIRPSSNLTSDGVLTIEVTNGAGPDFEYSLDGVNFSDSDIFDGLQSGTYEVTIRDKTGCELIIVVDLVPETISTDDILENELQKIYAFPNPTTGIISINVLNSNFEDLFIPVDILDINGKIIQRAELTRYSNAHKGMISLLHYPSGIYYLRIGNKDETIMTKVFKE